MKTKKLLSLALVLSMVMALFTLATPVAYAEGVTKLIRPAAETMFRLNGSSNPITPRPADYTGGNNTSTWNERFFDNNNLHAGRHSNQRYNEAYIRFDLSADDIANIKSASAGEVRLRLAKGDTNGTKDSTYAYLLPADKASAINLDYPLWRIDDGVVSVANPLSLGFSPYDAYTAGITVREHSATMTQIGGEIVFGDNDVLVYADMTSGLQAYFNDPNNANVTSFGLAFTNLVDATTGFVGIRRINHTNGPRLEIPVPDNRQDGDVTLSLEKNGNNNSQMIVTVDSGSLLVGDYFEATFTSDSSSNVTPVRVNVTNENILSYGIQAPYVHGNNDEYEVTVNLKNAIGLRKGTVTEDEIALYTAKVNFNKNTDEAVTDVPGNLVEQQQGVAFFLQPWPPERVNYNFDGWYTDVACTNAWNAATLLNTSHLDSITGVLNLYAKWTLTNQLYDVTTHDVAGEFLDKKTYYGGDSVYAYGRYNLTKPGYKLIGWSTVQDSSTATYQLGEQFVITSNVDLYPVWSPLRAGKSIEKHKIDDSNIGGDVQDAVFDSENNMYVARTGGLVYKISPDGTAQLILGNGSTDAAIPPTTLALKAVANSAFGIALDSAQNLYVSTFTDNNNIVRISNVNQNRSEAPIYNSTSAVGYLGKVTSGNSMGLSFDNEQNLLAGSTVNGTFYIYSNTGTLTEPNFATTQVITEFATAINTVTAIANVGNQTREAVVDNDGNLYFSSRSSHAIYMAKRTGQLTYDKPVRIVGNGATSPITPGKFTDTTIAPHPAQMAYDKENNIIYFVMDDVGRGVGVLDLNNERFDVYLGGTTGAENTSTTPRTFTPGTSNGVVFGGNLRGLTYDAYGNLIIVRQNNTYLVANHLSIAYDGNGNTAGQAPADSTALSGKTAKTAPGSELRKGNLLFAGWNTKADGTGTNYAVDADVLLSSTDITLYAQYSETPTEKPIIDKNGNSVTLDNVVSLTEITLTYVAEDVVSMEDKPTIGIYGANNQLLYVAVGSIAATDFGTVTIDLDSAIGAVEGAVSAKVMIWNDLTGTLNPVTASKPIN